MELRNKGVSQEDIDFAFQETEEGADTRERIRELIRKKRKSRGPWKRKSGRNFMDFSCAGACFLGYFIGTAGICWRMDRYRYISCLDPSLYKGPVALLDTGRLFREKRKLVVKYT